MKIIITLILIVLMQSAAAWDATGHRLIAAIAYTQLRAPTAVRVNRLSALMSDAHNPWIRFLQLSVWPDTLYGTGDKRFNHWHFVDYPIVKGGGHYNTYYPWDNANWAIKHCEKKLQNPAVSRRMQAHYLSFLIHVIGDAHQPLHCASLYSLRFPRGDAGGNAYLIQSPIAQNLHHLWDQGVGLFHLKGQKYPLSNRNITRLSRRIAKEYPVGVFSRALADHKVRDWTRESYEEASSIAYTIPYNSKPTSRYVTLGQRISAQRIALAAYRVATVLNHLYGKPLK
jgi:hypothetical protein